MRLKEWAIAIWTLSTGSFEQSVNGSIRPALILRPAAQVSMTAALELV